MTIAILNMVYVIDIDDMVVSVDTTKYRYVKVIKTVDEGLGLSELCVYGY